jgi:hypothetical protein
MSGKTKRACVHLPAAFGGGTRTLSKAALIEMAVE